MISTYYSRGWYGCVLAAVLIPCLWTGPARAESVAFKNECRTPVVIQVASVQRGVLKRDQILIRSGEATPRIPLNSDKVITIYCGQTGRVLFRDSLRASKIPLEFSILPDRSTGRIRILKQPPAKAAAVVANPG